MCTLPNKRVSKAYLNFSTKEKRDVLGWLLDITQTKKLGIDMGDTCQTGKSIKKSHGPSSDLLFKTLKSHPPNRT